MFELETWWQAHQRSTTAQSAKASRRWSMQFKGLREDKKARDVVGEFAHKPPD